jgi:hypothetical protein
MHALAAGGCTGSAISPSLGALAATGHASCQPCAAAPVPCACPPLCNVRWQPACCGTYVLLLHRLMPRMQACSTGTCMHCPAGPHMHALPCWPTRRCPHMHPLPHAGHTLLCGGGIRLVPLLMCDHQSSRRCWRCSSTRLESSGRSYIIMHRSLMLLKQQASWHNQLLVLCSCCAQELWLWPVPSTGTGPMRGSWVLVEDLYCDSAGGLV